MRAAWRTCSAVASSQRQTMVSPTGRRKLRRAIEHLEELAASRGACQRRVMRCRLCRRAWRCRCDPARQRHARRRCGPDARRPRRPRCPRHPRQCSRAASTLRPMHPPAAPSSPGARSRHARRQWRATGWYSAPRPDAAAAGRSPCCGAGPPPDSAVRRPDRRRRRWPPAPSTPLTIGTALRTARSSFRPLAR